MFVSALLCASRLNEPQVIGGSACGAVPLATGPRQWCQLSSRSGGTSPAEAATVAPRRIRAGISCFIAYSSKTLPGEIYWHCREFPAKTRETRLARSGGSHDVPQYATEPPHV